MVPYFCLEFVFCFPLDWLDIFIPNTCHESCQMGRPMVSLCGSVAAFSAEAPICNLSSCRCIFAFTHVFCWDTQTHTHNDDTDSEINCRRPNASKSHWLPPSVLAIKTPKPQQTEKVVDAKGSSPIRRLFCHGGHSQSDAFLWQDRSRKVRRLNKLMSFMAEVLWGRTQIRASEAPPSYRLYLSVQPAMLFARLQTG